MNLAKAASSTVQILGAEKSLFRALKSKKDTPKYGLIYHANLICNTNAKLRGKVNIEWVYKSMGLHICFFPQLSTISFMNCNVEKRTVLMLLI